MDCQPLRETFTGIRQSQKPESVGRRPGYLWMEAPMDGARTANPPPWTGAICRAEQIPRPSAHRTLT